MEKKINSNLQQKGSSMRLSDLPRECWQEGMVLYQTKESRDIFDWDQEGLYPFPWVLLKVNTSRLLKYKYSITLASANNSPLPSLWDPGSLCPFHPDE